MLSESSCNYRQSQAKVGYFRRVGVIFLIGLACVLTACGGGSSAPARSIVPNVEISLSPSTPTVSSGAKLQFVATLLNTSNTAVNWRTSAGAISDAGLFTAPTVTSPTPAIVTATSPVDGSVVATSQATIMPTSQLSIPIRSLQEGIVGTAYSATLSASGGVAPYHWQILNGSLPQGLSLDPNSGTISGIASQSGTFTFAASVADANSSTAKQSVSLEMNSANNANFDGPAELPRVFVQTSMSDTPAPGNVISVSHGGNFQNALNSAKCGDTIELQAGAVFTGQFTVPAQTCDDAHWIIVRTSTADASLPAEGKRISPCYAGVTSLRGRPALNCTSSTNVLAKIEFSGVGSGPLIFADGASHYRFIGLEITRAPATGVVYNLVVHQANGASDHIILDRSWLHGTAQDETQRGVMLSGVQYAAVIDSYLSDFHCVAVTGACGDSQAIAGGLGDLPSGPWKIVNNFLEAAAQSVLLGGGEATTTPSDIEIRLNHMFKPLTWMQGQPGFIGGIDGHAFIVKNLLELKNAQRVLIDGNIMEDTWGGFSEDGFAVLFTPKNQAGADGTNLCPICQVTDVTLRNGTISHVGSGLTIASGLSDNGGAPYASERYSIHDLIVDDIDPVKFAGNGNLAQISMGPACPTLSRIVINHVTAFPAAALLNIGDDAPNPPMERFAFTNNLVNSTATPLTTTGGGAVNCAYHKNPLSLLGACFSPYKFATNALIAPPSTYPASSWPGNNYFPASTNSVGFVNYNGGNGGDYHLQSSSPYKNAGSDGKDLGADIDAVESAIAGVE